MSNAKKAFLDEVRKGLSTIDPNNPSIPIIIESIEKMNKQQFENYIAALRNGVSETPDLDKPREIIPLVIPNMKPNNISIKRNIEVAKKWGHNFFERVWLTDNLSDTTYLTAIPYGVFELPVVRQAQTLEKGLSTTGSNTKLDSRTNQIAQSGKNKGSSFSAPELQTILSQGATKSAHELMKFRGGDVDAFNYMTRQIIETGHFRQDDYKGNTRPKATDVAGLYFTARHIGNDI